MKIDSNIKNYDILKQAKQKIPSFNHLPSVYLKYNIVSKYWKEKKHHSYIESSVFVVVPSGRLVAIDDK